MTAETVRVLTSLQITGELPQIEWWCFLKDNENEGNSDRCNDKAAASPADSLPLLQFVQRMYAFLLRPCARYDVSFDPAGSKEKRPFRTRSGLPSH